MRLERIKNTKRNVAFGVLYKIINTILPFINRTILLYILGTEYLGITSLFSSVIGILSLAELGFGNAVVYSLYKPIADNDTETIKSLVYYYKKIYRLIGLIILGLGIIVSFFINRIITGYIPKDMNIQILFLIQLLNVVLSYLLFAYKTSLLNAYQREDIISKISIVITILQYGCQFSVLIFTKNYYFYLLLLPICTLLSNIIRSFIVDKIYPYIREKSKIGVGLSIKKRAV